MNISIYKLLPRKWMSAIMYRLARIRNRLIKNSLIWMYIRVTGANTDFAYKKNPYAYASLNEFFTRALANNARPIDENPLHLISPVDGRCIMYGDIQKGLLFQAKAHTYTLATLLNAHDIAARLDNGQTITLYLAPDDYHRIHMPCDGELYAMSFCPGDKHSVALDYLEKIPNIFCGNERVVCHFYTAFGEMSLVLVGALNVSSITTVWHGSVENSPHNRYRYAPPLLFRKGEEIAQFNLGSTVILCWSGKRLQWHPKLSDNGKIYMGETIAKVDS